MDIHFTKKGIQSGGIYLSKLTEINGDQTHLSPASELVHDHVVDLVANRLKQDRQTKVLRNNRDARVHAIETCYGDHLYPDILCVKGDDVVLLCEVETAGTVDSISAWEWHAYSSFEGASFLLVVPEAELVKAHKLTVENEISCQQILTYGAKEA